MFDVPCELDSDIGNMTVFSKVTELPALEEIQFSDRHYDNRQGASTRRMSYNDDRRYDNRQGAYARRMSYGDDRRYDNRQGASTRRMSYNDDRPQSSRDNSAFSQRFSSSSYWKNQASRQRRDSIWQSDDE